jgi:hypothetical protein
MSYKQAMRFARNPKKGKAQPTHFSTLGEHERRQFPWLGSAWFQPGMEAARAAFIAEYHRETARLLRENPKMKIVK